jgi:uncharacterized phage-associated protein
MSLPSRTGNCINSTRGRIGDGLVGPLFHLSFPVFCRYYLKGMIDFTFNPKKAAQIACRLLEMNGGSMSKYKLIKMLYIIDREAMRKWGEPLTCDVPVSMEHGPALSNIYDLTKGAAPYYRDYWSKYVSDANDENHQVTKVATPQYDLLSKNEIRLIEGIYNEFKRFTWKQLKDHTHGFEEYEDVGKGSKSIKFQTILKAVGKTDTEIQELICRLGESRTADFLLDARS